jgi:bifunctional DNA-binding transcriptional regulator/antitoxin component of YhaV-PrlF toxin-antitoxin module
MAATILDRKRRTTLPESICEAADLRPNDQVEWRVENGEIRGRKLVPRKAKEAFPRGSLTKYLTPARDKQQLEILSGCVLGRSDER